jgi:hypothetical protein
LMTCSKAGIFAVKRVSRNNSDRKYLALPD